MIYSLVISVSDVRIRVTGTELTFLGLNHFRYALLQDANFPTDLLESLFLIVAGLPIVMVFSLVIALLLNRKFRGRAFFRALFFLPVIIMSGPVLTQLVQETDAMQLQMNYGILREYFYYLNGRFFVLFMDNLVRTLWFAGVQIMVFLAVLQKIDQSMYEAASIDGATGWETFWRITLPHLRPAILLNAIYTIVEMGSVSSDPTNVRIMTHLLEVNRPYSYSAAMAWIYAMAQLVLMGVTALILVEKRGRRAT
jgi:ABC-type sugar transport system permease subunit